jgi:uncharacterized membrane protein
VLQDTLAIIVVLFAVILIALILVEKYRWAEKASSVMLILLLGAVASNVGLVPTDAPIYTDLVGFSVPFAVCLVLFKVNLGDVRNAGKAMITAFAIASIGTVVGVLVAGLALDPLVEKILGDSSWKIAGPYTGTYIGGSLNFFALWEGLSIGQPDLFAAANAVDNLTLFPLLTIWLLVPTLLGNKFPVSSRWDNPALHNPDDEEERPPRFIPTQLVTLVLAALAVMAVSGWIKTTLIDPILPQVPTILIITTLALALGQLKFINSLEGAWEMGHMAFYVFFAAVGAMINIYNAVVLSPILFVYVLIIIAVHMTFVYGVGRLLKMDVGVLTIASSAAKAGPAMVLALAQTNKEWKHLALPGVIMGLVGYAIGNYIGFGVAYLLRAML